MPSDNKKFALLFGGDAAIFRAPFYRTALTLGVALLVCSTVSSAETMPPVVGSYGFDWLHPNTTRCQPVSEKLVKRFRRCEYKVDGTFGLSNPAHACRIGARIEYLIYASKAICVDNFETMQANAP